MITTITHTRRPLLLRLAKPLRIWMLRRSIASAEEYARNTERGGVFTSAQVAALRAEITPLRAALSLWEQF